MTQNPSHPCEPPPAPGARWLLAFVVAALALLAAASGWSDSVPAAATSETLRMHAEGGDAAASRTLTRELLDRYEKTGNPADLHNAMHWIDRDWVTPEFQEAGIPARLIARHCSDKLLRAHWLCNPAE